MTDITYELIDFRSPPKQDGNFRNPLVPLPKSETENNGCERREYLYSGDNPFDAVTLEAYNYNDPFEIVQNEALKQSAHSHSVGRSQGGTELESSEKFPVCVNTVLSSHLEVNKDKTCKKKILAHESNLQKNNSISQGIVLKDRFSQINLDADHEKQILDESSVGIEDLISDSTIFQSTPKKNVLLESNESPDTGSEKKINDIKAFVNSRIEKCIQKALNDSRQSMTTTFRHKRSLSAAAVHTSFGNAPHLSFNYFNSSSSTQPVVSPLRTQHKSSSFNRNFSFSSQDLRPAQGLNFQDNVPIQLNSSPTFLSEQKRGVHRRAHSASLDVLGMGRMNLSPSRGVRRTTALDFSSTRLQRSTNSSSLNILNDINPGARFSSNASTGDLVNVGMRRSTNSSSLDVLNTVNTGMRFSSRVSPTKLMNVGMRRSTRSSYLEGYNIGMRRSASTLDVATSLPFHGVGSLKRNAFSSNSVHQVSSLNLMLSPKVERNNTDFLKGKSLSCVSLEARNLSGMFRHKAETFDCPEAADSSGEEDFLTRNNWEVNLVDSDSDVDSVSHDASEVSDTQKCKENQAMGNEKHQQRGSRLSVESGIGKKGQVLSRPGPVQRSRSAPALAEPLSREGIKGLALRGQQTRGAKISSPQVRPPPVPLPDPGSGEVAATRLKPKTQVNGPAVAKGPLKAIIPLQNMMRNTVKKDTLKSSKRSPLNARCTNTKKQIRGISTDKPCPIAQSTPNDNRASTPKFQDSKILSPIVQSCDRFCPVPGKGGVEPLVSPPLSLRMPSSILATKPHTRSKSADQPPAGPATSKAACKVPRQARPQNNVMSMKKSISKSPIQEARKERSNSQYVTTPLRPRAGNSPGPGSLNKPMPAKLFRQLLWKKGGAEMEKENLSPSTAF